MRFCSVLYCIRFHPSRNTPSSFLRVYCFVEDINLIIITQHVVCMIINQMNFIFSHPCRILSATGPVFIFIGIIIPFTFFLSFLFFLWLTNFLNKHQKLFRKRMKRVFSFLFSRKMVCPPGEFMNEFEYYYLILMWMDFLCDFEFSKTCHLADTGNWMALITSLNLLDWLGK